MTIVLPPVFPTYRIFCMFFHFLWKYKCFKTPIVFPPAHLWSSFHFRDMDWSKNKICILFFWFFSRNKNEKNGLFCHQRNSGISFTRYWHPDFLWRDGVGLGWVLSRLMKFWNYEKFKIHIPLDVYFINSFNMVSTILFKMEWPDKRIVILYSLENSIGTHDIVLKRTCTVS